MSRMRTAVAGAGAVLNPRSPSFWIGVGQAAAAAAVATDLAPPGSVGAKLLAIGMAVLGFLGMGHAHLQAPPSR